MKSPDGLELPNPENANSHGNVAPIYVSPEDIKKETEKEKSSKIIKF